MGLRGREKQPRREQMRLLAGQVCGLVTKTDWRRTQSVRDLTSWLGKTCLAGAESSGVKHLGSSELGGPAEVQEQCSEGTIEKAADLEARRCLGACTAPVQRCGDASSLSDADDPKSVIHEPHDTSLGVRFRPAVVRVELRQMHHDGADARVE
jgi:hypothetical protein